MNCVTFASDFLNFDFFFHAFKKEMKMILWANSVRLKTCSTMPNIYAQEINKSSVYLVCINRYSLGVQSPTS